MSFDQIARHSSFRRLTLIRRSELCVTNLDPYIASSLLLYHYSTILLSYRNGAQEHSY
jgi:hypothetical protein